MQYILMFLSMAIVAIVGFCLHMAMNKPEFYSGFQIVVNQEVLAKGFKAWCIIFLTFFCVSVPMVMMLVHASR